MPFQSRNRGTFGFKLTVCIRFWFGRVGFNLVIEVLLVSSADGIYPNPAYKKFQSRNRGTFGFKGFVRRGTD